MVILPLPSHDTRNGRNEIILMNNQGEKNTPNQTGNLLASIGGLFTILSLTMFEDGTWKIIAALIGVALAFYGLLLIKKAENDKR